MKIDNYIYIFNFFFLLFFKIHDCSAQSYGLRFASNETDQDRRTGLDLSPGKTIRFNRDFEISFDLSFNPGRSEYFGYILRVICTQGKNIDLICDRSTPEGKHFQLVDGDRFTRIGFDIANTGLYNQWKSIKLKFNFNRNLITLFDGNRYYTDRAVIKKGYFKIMFGANGFGKFKTTDVPSMNLRNIRIREDEKTRFYWKLDEPSGEKAKEEVNSQDAFVNNPIWIRKMHQEWELKKTFSIGGIANVCFNAEKEDLYLVGEDSLLTYHLVTDNIESLHYRSGKHHMFRAAQSLFVPSSGNILNYYVDQKRVSVFNFKSSAWDKEFTYPDTASDYWQTNKFYSAYDNSLYVIGGYGHFRYWNLVQQYNLNTGSWKHVNYAGDFFTPRYLAAAGVTDKGAYILGGYGNATGRQALNPKSVYDFLFYNVKSQRFKKVYNLNIPHEEFAFANSLVIDSQKQVFYALIFPKHKYHSKLQMIESSLKQPVFREVGGGVPYLFRDITSFADLFYSPVSKRFIAVTLTTDINNENTKIAVYSLLGPPIAIRAEHAMDAHGVSKLLTGLLLAFCISMGLIYNYYRLRKTKRIVSPRVTMEERETKSEIAATIPEGLKEVTGTSISATVKKSNIFLFGDFQMFDENQNEVTRMFSPLIKELFLVILLYTIRWERGISSEKLKELLWFDKDTKLARNNRSVNIAKLKGILDKIPACRVSKETGFWKIDFDSNYLEIDYIKYLDIVKTKGGLNKERIYELAAITQRGGFLSNASYEWLDSFKAEISNEVIDTYQHFADSVKISEDPEFLVQVANYIFYFDPVNEEAMTMKCKALACLGKHSLARSSFESFVKEYKMIYGEDFNWDFNEVLNK